MGNETISRVVGIGTIYLKTSIGTKVVLNNVKHAPDVRLYLISIGVLDDEGYVSTIPLLWLVVTNVVVYAGLWPLLMLI